ncbi:smoothelin-like protein 2 isoform X5 [Gadus chalcogrammus]|uniref:smoothelin-like protein 2 isoform X5 n=1 Tax=Gadus chalcogrammus TaxID=1042646 RepID=UPI0024C4E309|nr:smoothelin-like protein 2 isoform X5 [Gadus chalcogrammus]
MPRVLVSVVAVPPSAMEDGRTALHLSTPPPSPAPEGGETVCAALARYEDTLRGTIREIHGDVSAFKLDVERRLEEAADAPIGRAVAQLQQENQQLRAQLDALAQQVELLSGMTYEHQGVSTWSDIYTNNSHHSNDTGNPSLNHHNRHHDDIGLDPHQEVTEAVHGKGQVQFPFQGSMCPRGPTSSLPPGSSSYPEPVCPPPGPRVTSMMTSAPGISDCPGTARFSSRATFALYSKANSVDHEEPIKVDHALKHSGPENGHTAHAVYLTHLSESPMLVHGQSSPPNNLPHEHTAAVSSRMLHLPMTAVTKVAEMRGPDSPRSPIGCQSSCVTEALLPASQSTESYCQPVSTAKAWTPASIRNLGFPRLPDKTNSAPAKSVTYSGLAPCEGHPKPADNKPKLQRSQSFGVSSASSIKQILLDWCRSKTLGYQSVELQNFSSSWSDGLAFCALVHSFFPSEFDYTSLSPAARKHNFELAFGTAEAKAGCDRLIEVEDMMIMGRKPDPMCVFTYVQSLYNHLRKFE